MHAAARAACSVLLQARAALCDAEPPHKRGDCAAVVWDNRIGRCYLKTARATKLVQRQDFDTCVLNQARGTDGASSTESSGVSSLSALGAGLTASCVAMVVVAVAVVIVLVVVVGVVVSGIIDTVQKKGVLLCSASKL